MFRLYTRINTDGDFSYKAELPNSISLSDYSRAVYFEKRDSITPIITKFYADLCNTISGDKDYIINYVKKAQATLNAIFKKRDTFYVNMCFGNQSIEICVELIFAEEVTVCDSGETIKVFPDLGWGFTEAGYSLSSLIREEDSSV